MLIIPSLLLGVSFLTQVAVLAAPIPLNSVSIIARALSLKDDALFSRTDESKGASNPHSALPAGSPSTDGDRGRSATPVPPDRLATRRKPQSPPPPQSQSQPHSRQGSPSTDGDRSRSATPVSLGRLATRRKPPPESPPILDWKLDHRHFETFSPESPSIDLQLSHRHFETFYGNRYHPYIRPWYSGSDDSEANWYN